MEETKDWVVNADSNSLQNQIEESGSASWGKLLFEQGFEGCVGVNRVKRNYGIVENIQKEGHSDNKDLLMY